jgi:hypothetical protein
MPRLLRSLMAYLRGEPKVWSALPVPSVAEEDERRLHRERDRRQRTSNRRAASPAESAASCCVNANSVISP